MLFRNILKSQRSDAHSQSSLIEKFSGKEKVLVIHPQDPTTEFLSETYRGRYAINSIESKDIYRSRIGVVERTVLLGHGFPQGLAGGGKIIIDDSFADLFRNQPNNVYVFCNADCYAWRNKLRGFATGMFISEPLEAQIFNVDVTPNEIEASNELFARLMSESIDFCPPEILDFMKTNYNIPGNAAVEYNRNGFRVFE